MDAARYKETIKTLSDYTHQLRELHEERSKTLAELLKLCLQAVEEVNPHNVVEQTKKQRELRKQLRQTLPRTIGLLTRSGTEEN
jgi:hypothetical protein